jgi:hypothetical protein
MTCPGVPMRLLHPLEPEEVDAHHYLDCPHADSCLDWVAAQSSPRWRAYTCRYCFHWTRRPEIEG